MAHRRSNSRGRFDKKIETTRWAGANHAVLALSAGAVAQTMVTDGLQETFLRLRGELVAWLDNPTSPIQMVDVAIGALVVQAGSGTTIIQKPITDPDAPWFFYERFCLAYEEKVVDVVAVQQLIAFRKTIDAKAMRILREGREVQLVIEQATIDGAGVVNLNLNFRALLGTT